MGVAVAVAVGVGVGVAVGVAVAVAVGVGVGVTLGVAVAVAVGVGVGVGVIPNLAFCIAVISLLLRFVFHIATCCMLPLANVVVPLYSMCIRLVRLHVLPVASVELVVATLTPSTNRSNVAVLRRNVIECQVPSNAVPPEMGLLMKAVLPRAMAEAAPVVPFSPMCARLFVVVDPEIDTACPELKSVPPLNSAKKVKFVLSKLGITESFLLA